jgi:hypothetical protein
MIIASRTLLVDSEMTFIFTKILFKFRYVALFVLFSCLLTYIDLKELSKLFNKSYYYPLIGAVMKSQIDAHSYRVLGPMQIRQVGKLPPKKDLVCDHFLEFVLFIDFLVSSIE